jgi:organic radical activating enzyme
VVLENPVSADAAATLALSLSSLPGTHSISVTGGEPLEQPEFLEVFLGLARRSGLPMYLETNGLDTGALESVLDLVDILSLDIKLPSLCGGDNVFAAYRETLSAAAGRNVFCKIVVTEVTDMAEFGEAVGIIAGTDTGIPLVIQPATPAQGSRPPDPAAILELAAAAAPILEDVRVIPQCHMIMGLP